MSSLVEDEGFGFWGWDDEVVVIGWEAKDLALLRVGQGCMKLGVMLKRHNGGNTQRMSQNILLRL